MMVRLMPKEIREKMDKINKYLLIDWNQPYMFLSDEAPEEVKVLYEEYIAEHGKFKTPYFLRMDKKEEKEA